MPPVNMFDDYLEVATQFAVTSAFAGVCPEVVVFAVLHLVAELSTDSYKMSQVHRRTVLSSGEIATWVSVVEAIAFGSTVVGFLILHTSCPQYPVHAVLVLEHVVLLVKCYLGWAIADTPEDVTARKIRLAMDSKSKRTNG